ncbi:MAG: hypothetical protein KDA75_13740, partial [Planctomycetaceae bacterium]|nr:hypothetical protein [Planctomycetaceae bacterium]
MTDSMTKEEFVELLRPLAEALRAVDVDAPDAAQQAERAAAFGGEWIAAIRRATYANADGDWLMPKEAGGIRFGR